MRFDALSPVQAVILLALVAGAILVLYWLRPPPRRVIIPSSFLWELVLKERKSRYDRLRWLLSLLLALAIGLALALALTGPQLEGPGGTGREVVVILDNAPTMAARTTDGRTRWDHALERAREVLSRGGAGSRFLLVDTTGQISSTRFVTGREAVRALGRLTVSFTESPAIPRLSVEDSEIYVVSDGVMIDVSRDIPLEAEVISVFEPADNVAITAFEVGPVPGIPDAFQGYIETRNFSPEPKRVNLQLSGVGGHRIRRTLDLDAGGKRGESLDLSEFDAGPLRATVTAIGDAWERDDVAYAFLPPHRKVRVALVTAGNRFLELALRLAPQVELTTGPPGEPSSNMAADVYVFDRWAPQVPPSNPAILFCPPETPWLPKIVGERLRPDIVEREQDHPLLESVDLKDLELERAVVVEPEDARIVLGEAREPLILVSESHHRWILVTFDIAESNFALQPGFPIFVANALTWAQGPDRILRRPVGVVRVPLSNAVVTGLNGLELPTHNLGDQTAFEARDPGVYTATRGARRLRVVVNSLDPTASDINRSPLPLRRRSPEGGRGEQRGGEGNTAEPWLYLVGAAVLLLTLEWWTYHRRLTV